jgi:ribosomal protein S18 acetylase RimI-like enzyme
MTVVVRRLTTPEIARACEVVGLAFADNPSTLANTGGDHRRAERTMRRVVRVAKLARPTSRVLVAELDRTIVGVLNAAPWPRCQMTTIDRVRMAPAFLRALGTALPSAAKMMAARGRHDPHEAHWHIGPVAVHPHHQGHGIGTELLAAFLAEIDGAEVPAFLETDVDRNVELYEKLGFQIVSRENIIGVDTRFMLRPAVFEP